MCGGGGARRRDMEIEARREADGTSMSSRSCSKSVPLVSGFSYIEHRVSKMDTLAGVAIKYGVEVADIKKINGLVTDIQMFGHRSIQIPLPGRHPPSSFISNCSSSNGEKSAPAERKVSSAMRVLQGYYGLTPPRWAPQSQRVNRLSSEDIERETDMPPWGLPLKEEVGSACWREFPPRQTPPSQPVNGLYLEEIERETKTLPRELLLKEEIGSVCWKEFLLRRASRSQPVNGFSPEEVERERKTPPPAPPRKEFMLKEMGSVGRRVTQSQRVNGHPLEEIEGERKMPSTTPPPPHELLLKEERGSPAFSARPSGKKGLALRQKSPSVTNLVEACGGGSVVSLSTRGGGESVSLSSAAGKVVLWRAKGSALEGMWKNKAALD